MLLAVISSVRCVQVCFNASSLQTFSMKRDSEEAPTDVCREDNKESPPVCCYSNGPQAVNCVFTHTFRAEWVRGTRGGGSSPKSLTHCPYSLEIELRQLRRAEERCKVIDLQEFIFSSPTNATQLHAAK